VCRSAVQLLVHLGSIDAAFLRRVLGLGLGLVTLTLTLTLTLSLTLTLTLTLTRRVLGCNELRVQTFHLAHLVLQHYMEAVNGAAAASAHGSASASSRPVAPPLPAGVAAELTALLHEMLLLLGQFTLGSPANEVRASSTARNFELHARHPGGPLVAGRGG